MSNHHDQTPKPRPEPYVSMLLKRLVEYAESVSQPQTLETSDG